MDTDMLNEVADDEDDEDPSMRLIFDWTDDDLYDEYFYNYDND